MEMSIQSVEELEVLVSKEASKFTEDRLCELSKEMSVDSQSDADGFDKYDMMKALSDGGLLLREGRLIKREDRTNPDRFAA